MLHRGMKETQEKSLREWPGMGFHSREKSNRTVTCARKGCAAQDATPQITPDGGSGAAGAVTLLWRRNLRTLRSIVDSYDRLCAVRAAKVVR
jgi:hypothetical protein